MEQEIINKVANSGLVELNLEDFYTHGARANIDLKDQLFMGLILKEKDFREWIKTYDWQQYQNKYVAVFCSADAIIPVWAYMLVASQLSSIAKKVVLGTQTDLETILYHDAIQGLDIQTYADQRIIIKGCGNLPVPESAYLMITAKLQPVAKSIMYGEACSTVPVYKQGKGNWWLKFD